MFDLAIEGGVHTADLRHPHRIDRWRRSPDADVVFVRRHALPDQTCHLSSILSMSLVLVVYCLEDFDDLPVVCTVAESPARRLAVGLDLEVRHQPRGVTQKPWNELVVHVKLDRVHFLRSRHRCAPLLCNLLVCSLDVVSTCVELRSIVSCFWLSRTNCASFLMGFS